MANRIRRIGIIICILREDINSLMEDIITATHNKWRCHGDSVELDGKRFIFSFDNKINKKITIRKQPRIILGQVMIIHEATKENFIEDLELNDVPF